MKKLLMIFLTIVSFSYAEGEYQSNFGLGIGVGVPSGYEFKGIYRQSEWLSLSLNYNLFEIKGISKNISDTDKDVTVTGDITFSTPGVLVHYHPFGGNLRLTAGFLYDNGGINIDANGTMDLGGISDVPVTGHIALKMGTTFPYLGVSYGYDYSSVVHIEFTLGAYLVKRPTADLYFNVGNDATITTMLTDAGIDPSLTADIITALDNSGGNILDLVQIIADEFGLPNTLVLPNEQNLENDLIATIQDGYAMLPEFMGYSVLPMVSVGFVFFPF